MYPRFFRFFYFLHFISYNNNSFMWLDDFRKQKNFEETYLQPRRFMSLHLHLPFDFSDARLLGHSSYFEKLFLVIFHAQPFNAGGLWECYTNWIKSHNTQRLRPNNLIFLVSFVLLSSPKQSRHFTNFHQQIIGVIWLTEKFAFYYRCVSIDVLP